MDVACGSNRDNSVIWYVFSNNCLGRNNCAIANLHTIHYNDVSSNPYIMPDGNAFVLIYCF